MSLIFGNFYFDYYTFRFELGLRLGFGLGLGLRLGLGLGVSFLSFISKCLHKWNICQASSKSFKLSVTFSLGKLKLLWASYQCFLASLNLAKSELHCKK